MTQNRRIVLNIVATYGRSLYALVIGLFTARWVLMALGDIDFGLVGVVGGLVAFVSFLNAVMAGAVGRFYAYSVGAAQIATDQSEAIEDCRRWFSIALAIHTVLPIALVAVGYPIGEWAVRHFLTIPDNRIAACVWVWRFSCLSCFCSMLNVPFAAMYNAKQEIAELTFYGFVTTTLNAVILYYMVHHPGDWLTRYSLMTCLLAVVPQALIAVRAHMVYQECRFRFTYVLDACRIRDLASFAGSTFFSSLSTLFVNQGTAVLVNKILGPAANAAMTIGNQVSAHSLTLSNAIVGALSPAITNAAGAKQINRMGELADTACKIGAVLVLVFSIPLFVEIEEVMVLWLKTPPAGATALCSVLLWVLVIDKLDSGLPLMIFANGKVFAYQIIIGIVAFSVFLFAWGFLAFGVGVVAFGIARALGKLPAIVIRLYFCKKLLSMPPSRWIRNILIPIVFSVVFTLPFAYIPKLLLEPSFVRIVLTTLVSEVVFLPVVWFVVLDVNQRFYLKQRVGRFIGHTAS